MNEQKTAALQQTRSAVMETAARIDEVASLAMSNFAHAGSMAAELQVAQGMADLRSMLTPEIMKPIMALMDTDLGFRTDRDPRQNNPKTNQPNVPYPVEVVKDVVIEAKLRGFHTIGNEFNIISGRFYAAKGGFRRKLTDGKSFPTLANFKDSYDVPRIVGDKGAIVKCRAEWTLAGKKDSIECEFAIKVNAFMGADAILGKAERKLCKRVHDLISGVHTPDSEIGEAEEVEVVNQSRVSAPPSIPDPTPTQTAQPVVDAKPKPSAPLTNDRFAELESLIAGTCATFDDFVAVMTSNSVWKPFVDGVASVPDMKLEHVGRVLTKRGFLSKALAAVVAERKGGSV